MQVKDLERNRPAPPIPAWFEKKLLQRFGRTSSGKPRVILEWGQTPNVLIYGLPRLKWEYLDKRYKVLKGLAPVPGSPVLQQTFEWIEVGIPRFFACELIPAALLGPQDWDEKVLGPFPSAGQYRSFLRLDDPLTGEYMPPSNAAFRLIEEVWHMREQGRRLHSLDEQDDGAQEQAELRAKAALVNRGYEQFWQKAQDAMESDVAPFARRLLSRNPNKGVDSHTRRRT